jgi:hypothetical protein
VNITCYWHSENTDLNEPVISGISQRQSGGIVSARTAHSTGPLFGGWLLSTGEKGNVLYHLVVLAMSSQSFYDPWKTIRFAMSVLAAAMVQHL